MNHKIEAIVEISDAVSGWTDRGFKTAKAIAASEAFRKYSWIKKLPIMNSEGNFRGMVVSSRWATTFHFTEGVLKPLEKVAVFAALAANLVRAADETDRILASSDSWGLKGSRLSTQVTSVCVRTAFGAIPAGAHVLAISLGGYLQLADLAGLHQANPWNKAVRSLDAYASTTFDTVTDGNNIYLKVNKYLAMR
jgi:hypothetical protein